MGDDSMPADEARRLATYRELYRRTLLDDVAPFWLRHGIDREFGGVGNILDDAGRRVGNDKYLWSQGRALWTFAALYNRVERRSQWLEAARHVFQYLRTHGRDERGNWLFRLDERGRTLDGDESIYVDGFVLAGLTEYFRATQDASARDLALETYECTRRRLATRVYGTAPYPVPPGLKAHGVPMVFGLFYFELGRALQRDDIRAAGLELARQVLSDFYVRDKNAILEFVRLDGAAVDSPEGRACVPGHALESLWFLIHMFEQSHEPELIPLCCRLIRRHLELGWDDHFGGLKLALDIDGQEAPYWRNADCKAWWVQIEAMVATAYAYRHTGDIWCLQWHDRLHQYAFSHYPVATGEWTQWLDRRGHRTTSAALPVKDPFHLPRALIELLRASELDEGDEKLALVSP